MEGRRIFDAEGFSKAMEAARAGTEDLATVMYSVLNPEGKKNTLNMNWMADLTGIETYQRK